MPHRTPRSARAQIALGLGSLGVVFGDIGTSPLYTMQECMTHVDARDPASGVLGILSLIFWSLFLVVSVKYIWYIMTADNQGEGGIFALLALIHSGGEGGAGRAPARRGLGGLVVMILVGAALLYGDGIITPAITVLGAADGFNAISPDFAPYVPAIACVILALLFWVQRKGTRAIGSIFGPIMLVWFFSLAALGAWHLYQAPGVLRALNPIYGLRLLCAPPPRVAALLGSVVLAITGAEALYADMGHFGRRAITAAWYLVAFPALILNYFGQGAFVLTHPAAHNPFFDMAPTGLARALLTGLSIAAAIIGSQALISGAYSLTRQAIQLGYFPRLRILYTNSQESGQIYVPFVNTLLTVGCILTAALFGSACRLASAYGIAVTGTMAITTVAYFIVARRNWHWSLWRAGPICALFLLIDLAFFFSNARKLTDGGWFPLAIAASVLAIMHTWKTGRDAVYRLVYGGNVTESELLTIARSHHIVRVPGTGVFMVGSPEGTPLAVLHHVKANRCLQKNVLLVSVVTEDVPTVPEAEHLQLREIGEGVWRAVGHYGYMESPDVGNLVEQVKARGVGIKPQAATYYFNREMIMSGGSSGMWEWEKKLYSFLTQNARPARDYYRIPVSQIIEIGLPLEL